MQGAMTFGEPGKEGARAHDIKDVEAILDAFRAHGDTEVRSNNLRALGSHSFLLTCISYGRSTARARMRGERARSISAGSICWRRGSRLRRSLRRIRSARSCSVAPLGVIHNMFRTWPSRLRTTLRYAGARGAVVPFVFMTLVMQGLRKHLFASLKALNVE